MQYLKCYVIEIGLWQGGSYQWIQINSLENLNAYKNKRIKF